MQMSCPSFCTIHSEGEFEEGSGGRDEIFLLIFTRLFFPNTKKSVETVKNACLKSGCSIAHWQPVKLELFRGKTIPWSASHCLSTMV